MKTLATAMATATIAAVLTTAPAQATDPRPPSEPDGVFVSASAKVDTLRVGWSEPTRTGSRPIRRYVVRWDGNRMVVPASTTEVVVTDIPDGPFRFRVRAVSRAGAGSWALSRTVYPD